MKKIIYLLLPGIMALLQARACDVCGCSASSQFLGVLPGAEYNFAGLQYLHSDYSGFHPSLYENRPLEHSHDYYNTLQLWGRYNIAKHYQLFVFVPYQDNLHRQDSANSTNKGIGDISVIASRQVLDKEHKGWTQLLTAGAGLKLPTGRHDSVSVLDRQGLPNMQPGTGAADILINANYTLRRRQAGLNAEAAYTFTTPSRDSYKYGNRFTGTVLGFYSLTAGKVSLMPVTGVRYEYTLHDYDNYRRRWLNEQSGGYMCFAVCGVQAYYKHIGARITYQLPMYQHYASGYVSANNKSEAGVFVLF